MVDQVLVELSDIVVARESKPEEPLVPLTVPVENSPVGLDDPLENVEFATSYSRPSRTVTSDRVSVPSKSNATIVMNNPFSSPLDNSPPAGPPPGCRPSRHDVLSSLSHTAGIAAVIDATVARRIR